jgi:hypothetical protein
MNRYKKHWPNQNHNRWEDAVGWSLAVVGIAVVWGVALSTLADQPFQHGGTQVLRRVK